MAKLTLLMIHCAASIEGRDVRPSDIERMHKGARMIKGRLYYKGKRYKSREELPDEIIGGVLAKNSHGRGWSQVGYARFFTNDGENHLLVGYNSDNWIDSGEITNGARGMNRTTRHFSYSGGLDRNRKIVITLNPAQERSLIKAIFKEIEENPSIKVGGHNQYAKKGCPSFNCALWLEAHDIPKKNIDTKKMIVTLKPVFKNKTEGDKFRVFVNNIYPDYAKKIDLDRSGSYQNDYILKAFYKYRHEFKALTEQLHL